MFLSFSKLSTKENGSIKANKASSEQRALEAVIKDDLMLTPFIFCKKVKARVIRQ